ncbi:MAG: hypothetical protein ACR2PZ_13500 [Pseudomonadales bacterium]
MRLLLLVGLLCASTISLADSHSNQAELGPIAETFSCNFSSGKDADDLWSGVDFFNKQVDKIDSKDLKEYFAAILFPLRATMPGDYGWIGYWPSLNAMGRGLEAYLADSGGQAADKRFAGMSNCDSNVWTSTSLVSNFPEQDATPDSDGVELYMCKLRKGATLAAAAAAEQGFVNANGKEPIVVDRWVPLFANTPYDLVYLVAHENLSQLTSFNSRWLTSKAGQANGELFNAAMNCESGIFTGRVIRDPEEE